MILKELEDKVIELKKGTSEKCGQMLPLSNFKMIRDIFRTLSSLTIIYN